jgi:hypothetical protein
MFAAIIIISVFLSHVIHKARVKLQTQSHVSLFILYYVLNLTLRARRPDLANVVRD